MKKSDSPKIVFALWHFCFCVPFSWCTFATPPESQMYYELKIYRLKDSGKNAIFDKYLKDAFIPAMHKAGIPKIGVFKPVEADTAFGKMIYVFIPYENMDQYNQVLVKLESDPAYQKAGKDFLDAPYNDAPFTRYESVFMKAFCTYAKIQNLYLYHTSF